MMPLQEQGPVELCTLFNESVFRTIILIIPFRNRCSNQVLTFRYNQSLHSLLPVHILTFRHDVTSI